MDKELLEKQELWKAGMAVKLAENRLGGELTYDEAIKLGEQAVEFLSGMTPLDPAYTHFIEVRSSMYIYADALNTVNNLGRTDHFNTVDLIVSYDNGRVVEEMTVPVTKSYVLFHDVMVGGKSVKKFFSENAVLSATRTELIRKGVPIKLFHDLEIVPL